MFFPLKPKRWKGYVEDAKIVWPHGKENLDRSLEHLNNQNTSIKFKMEIKNLKGIPFIDVLIFGKEDGSLAHQVYELDIHTNTHILVHIISQYKNLVQSTL